MKKEKTQVVGKCRVFMLVGLESLSWLAAVDKVASAINDKKESQSSDIPCSVRDIKTTKNDSVVMRC